MREVRRSKLVIIGDGPERGRLEELASEHHIKNVEFVGTKSGDELKYLVRHAMFVVIPSEWYENSPMVIYEAFAMGKPVIGAALGGISELIDHKKNGLLFEAKNVEDLARCIHYFLLRPEEVTQCGIRARKMAERAFGPENHYREMMGIYEELLSASYGLQEQGTPFQ